MKVFFVRHGETQANLEKRAYFDITENITNKGCEQAILAGKYLKTFGKFDLVISSPATRCIQTAEHICKEINYTDKITINDLLLEKICKNVAGLSVKEIENIFIKNVDQEKHKLFNEYINTDNPFRRIEIMEKNKNIVSDITGEESLDDTIKNLKKFLKQLTKLDYNNILVVGHGGTNVLVTNIITNIPLENNKTPKSCISIRSNEAIKQNVDSKSDEGNTTIMACLINKKKFTLVIPSNTLHLSKN